MSRCFPFPPPGYEKKSRSDDSVLLNKEKQREKKPKKEKNKEKREGKEKKEKDKRDGQHRDKKVRKDKTREKKKKERDKDIDKKTPSDEKRLAVQSDSHNREKLNLKENERDKDKDQNSISDEKKQALQFQGRGGDKPTEGTGDHKFVQELYKRIREGGTRSQLVDRLLVTEQKNDERNGVVVKDARILAGGKEKNNEKGVDNRKTDGVVAICSGSAVVQNLVGLAQNRVEDIPRSLEKQIERRMEKKEKSKEREGDDKRREKRKDKDKEKKSHGKDKEREKEKKKEEKVREKSEHKTEDGGKLKDSSKNDQVGTLNVIYTHGAKDGDINTAIEGILKKRKVLEANGFLHAADVWPNKKPRPSPHPSTENGRKLEPSHTAILFTSDDTDGRPIKLPRLSPHPSVEIGRKLQPSQAPIHLTSDKQAPPNNLKLNNKEPKINGIIKSHPLPISSKNSPSPSTQAEKIAQASTKSPHPDSKYLSQVLSVPKMEEWSDFDDQEWLFNSKDCSAEKKPKVGSSVSPRVWAEALQIESADVCALPYVIPY